MEPILRAPRPVDASGRLRGEVLISAKTRGLGWLRGGRAAPGTFLELGPEGLALSGLGGGRSLQPSYARSHVVTSEQKPLAPPRRLHGGHESPELAELAVSQDRSSAVGEFQELGLVWERVPWVGASLLRRGPGRQHPSLGQPPPGFRAKQKFLW